MLIINTFVYSSEEVPSKAEVSKLYVATFSRAPDSAGLSYWTNDSGLSLSKIAQSFFDQPETQILYPPSTANGDFVTSVYQNLFNRVPDTAGLNYWENELNTGAFSKNRFIEAVINGALDTAESQDATILNNKNEVGLYFANQGLDNADEARNTMSGVTASGSSITFIKTKIDERNLTSDIWSTYSDQAFSTSTEASFKTIVDSAFGAKANKAGMTVAVYSGSGNSWKYALGDASSTVAMTTDTPVQLYSITKTMTSAKILKLVENGVLSLTDTVSKALTGHADLSSFDASKINLDATIEQLLKHTSGIKTYQNNSAGIQALSTSTLFGTTWKPASLISLVQDNFSNVGTHHYSDTNFILLGMIAEHNGGSNLSQQFTDDFFTPLGISGTLLPRNTLPATLAKPFDDLASQGGSSGFGNLLSAQPFFLTAMGIVTWSAAGMSMTADNVAKWGYELYSVNGQAVSSAVRTMLLNSPTEQNSNYGYGITRVNMTLNGNTVDLYGHGGGGAGYLTILYYSPDTDLSIALLVNSNNTTNNAAIDTFDGGSLYDTCVALFNAYQ